MCGRRLSACRGMLVVLLTCGMSQVQHSVYHRQSAASLHCCSKLACTSFASVDSLRADCVAIVGRDAVPHSDRGDWRWRCSRRQQW